MATLNRVLHMHRAATADPHVRELRREQAVVVRVGYGEGDQVAEGRWVKALELPPVARRTRRDAALRPQERLGALLGGPRRRAGLRGARPARAPGRRRRAPPRGRPAARRGAHRRRCPSSSRGRRAATSPQRLAELRELHGAVHAAAQAALQGGVEDEDDAAVRHALERLEAALRARTALGFD